MSKLKRALLLQLCLLALVVAAIAWATRYFPLMEYLVRAQQKIGAMQLWGGVLYPLLYAACNVLLLPGGVLAIGSGFFFGLWWGFFLNVVGNVTGAAVAFFISRKLGRRWVEKQFFQRRKWAVLDAAIARDGWKIIFLSQVHPLFPTSLLNYLYGITRMSFGTCMLWVAIGQAPGLFLYAYLGTITQLGIRVLRGQSHPQPMEYYLWIGGLILTIVATYALTRIALRVLAEIEAFSEVGAEPKAVKEDLETVDSN